MLLDSSLPVSQSVIPYMSREHQWKMETLMLSEEELLERLTHETIIYLEGSDWV
jgi:hypothetical protein